MIRTLALATALLSACAPAFAACSVEIGGNDAMQFDRRTIEVDRACTDFTVTLRHTGKLAKNVMGHNWVLTTTADMPGTASDGQKAGLAAGFLKAGDARVIAHTPMIGGGESTSVTFAVARLAAGTAYTYFCSFPGHWGIMKGTLTLK